jgi:hypothetical protein
MNRHLASDAGFDSRGGLRRGRRAYKPAWPGSFRHLMFARRNEWLPSHRLGLDLPHADDDIIAQTSVDGRRRRESSNHSSMEDSRSAVASLPRMLSGASAAKAI